MHKTAQESTHALLTPLQAEAKRERRRKRYLAWKEARAAATSRAEATLLALGAEPYVDLDTAAAFLAFKPSQVYELVRLGKLPSHKAGKFRRFRLSELEMWMQNGRDNGKA